MRNHINNYHYRYKKHRLLKPGQLPQCSEGVRPKKCEIQAGVKSTKTGEKMKNQADYSLYKCPYSHLEKECGHKLKGPEGYDETYGVWCACGFRGPVFYLNPEDLKLEKIKLD